MGPIREMLAEFWKLKVSAPAAGRQRHYNNNNNNADLRSTE